MIHAIAILGCGPAGLLAAHAVELSGHQPVILSWKNKSTMPGAQFVGAPIPELTKRTPDASIKFVKKGTREGYARKVYGDPGAPCSWDDFPEGDHPGWSMQRLYNQLWSRYENGILEADFPQGIDVTISDEFPLVISSIPARVLCNRRHSFHSASIRIKHSVPDGIVSDNIVIYNGDSAEEWYRSSRLFGSESTESAVPPNAPLIPKQEWGEKPLWTDCDCHPDIMRVGRFGEWKKGVLVHHAFERTLKAMVNHFGVS